MMNVKFVRVKVTKSEFFSFFFFFRKLTSSSSVLFCAPDKFFPIIYMCMCIVYPSVSEKKGAVQKKKKVYF